jgi:hypothetical protein
MSKGLQADRQWYLFEKRLGWHEFPEDIREQVIQLLATMCVEIVDELQPQTELKEQHDERTEA